MKSTSVSHEDLVRLAQFSGDDLLTLIMACIIYWQAKEINRVLLYGEPEKAGVDVSLLEHISPIGWENVLLYANTYSIGA